MQSTDAKDDYCTFAKKRTVCNRWEGALLVSMRGKGLAAIQKKNVISRDVFLKLGAAFFVNEDLRLRSIIIVSKATQSPCWLISASGLA